ncbi:MAG: flavodoxin domain-containing protein [Fastidiosipilaceae bacterium]
MEKLIIYGSQYGTSKRYAEKFSEITEITVMDYQDVKDISHVDLIIFFGGLYAGGVKGLDKTLKKLSPSTNLIIATVGLADVNDQNNTGSIKKSLEKQVPRDVLDRSQIFHLRGGIDYSKLSIVHKTMMTLLYKKVSKLPEEERSSEVKELIKTFNSHVDFVDFNALEPIIQASISYDNK